MQFSRLEPRETSERRFFCLCSWSSAAGCCTAATPATACVPATATCATRGPCGTCLTTGCWHHTSRACTSAPVPKSSATHEPPARPCDDGGRRSGGCRGRAALAPLCRGLAAMQSSGCWSATAGAAAPPPSSWVHPARPAPGATAAATPAPVPRRACPRAVRQQREQRIGARDPMTGSSTTSR